MVYSSHSVSASARQGLGALCAELAKWQGCRAESESELGQQREAEGEAVRALEAAREKLAAAKEGQEAAAVGTLVDCNLDFAPSVVCVRVCGGGGRS